MKEEEQKAEGTADAREMMFFFSFSFFLSLRTNVHSNYGFLPGMSLAEREPSAGDSVYILKILDHHVCSLGKRQKTKSKRV